VTTVRGVARWVVGQVLAPTHHREAGCSHWPTIHRSGDRSQYPPGALTVGVGVALLAVALLMVGVTTNQTPLTPWPLDWSGPLSPE